MIRSFFHAYMVAEQVLKIFKADTKMDLTFSADSEMDFVFEGDTKMDRVFPNDSSMNLEE